MTRPEARRILNFWEAVETVWPLPDPWAQTAMVCHQLSKGHALQMATVGQDYEVLPPEHFMPPRFKRTGPPVAPAQPADEQAKTLDSAFKGW